MNNVNSTQKNLKKSEKMAERLTKYIEKQNILSLGKELKRKVLFRIFTSI